MVHEAEGVSKVLAGDLGGRRRGDIPPARKIDLGAGDGAYTRKDEKEIHSNIADQRCVMEENGVATICKKREQTERSGENRLVTTTING